MNSRLLVVEVRCERQLQQEPRLRPFRCIPAGQQEPHRITQLAETLRRMLYLTEALETPSAVETEDGIP